jgi:hypothetical protein
MVFVPLIIRVKQENTKRASELFHSIIKASVSPKATGAAEKKDKNTKPKAKPDN